MFRKIRLIAITLSLSLIFGSISSFAASWNEEPEDPSNPRATIIYTCEDGTNFDRLSFKADAFESVDFVFDGFAYESGKTYVEAKRFDRGYAVADGKLYRLHNIGGWTPGTYNTPAGVEPDFTGSSIGYYMELVPTDEMPEKSMTSVALHKTGKDVITEKYLVNGKEVSKAEYEKAKTGSYTIKTLKKFTGYGKETIDKEDMSFSRIIKLKQTGPGADTAPWSATFEFKCDRYITVQMNYLKTYEIEKAASTSSGSSSSSITKKTSSAAKKTTAKKTSTNYTIVMDVSTVSATSISTALKKSGVKPASVKTIILSKKVKKIKPSAFKNFKNAKTLVIKTKSLKKASVKNSLKGSAVTKITVQPATGKSKALKAYKKIFTKANAGKSVKMS